ncbi:hypothetical protein QR680_006534 [Steinernema hermaphroditum]|uniref:F-box domain-containing protein n=1 Tax=Steinernema hermaphroditum TaxID=289476 RepID=A0AA39HVS1_9BILA|nr:hypothetical protein QR680_006534 [Steinernema hermaphroditum]
MGNFLCKEYIIYDYDDHVLLSICSVCDSSKEALKLRRVSRRFRKAIDSFLSFNLDIKVVPHGGCQFCVYVNVSDDSLNSKAMFLKGKKWKVADVDALNHMDFRSLSLAVYANGSESYMEMIHILRNQIIMPIAITSHISNVSLTVLNCDDWEDGGKVFKPLHQLIRAVLRNAETITLNIYPNMVETIDFIRFLLGLNPKNLIIHTDYPDTKELVAIMKSNFITNFTVSPTYVENDSLQIDFLVFLHFEELMEEWSESSQLHSNIVTFNFRVPSDLWELSSDCCQCRGVDSRPSSQFFGICAVLEHSIQMAPFNMVHGSLCLSMREWADQLQAGCECREPETSRQSFNNQ